MCRFIIRTLRLLAGVRELWPFKTKDYGDALLRCEEDGVLTLASDNDSLPGTVR